MTSDEDEIDATERRGSPSRWTRRRERIKRSLEERAAGNRCDCLYHRPGCMYEYHQAATPSTCDCEYHSAANASTLTSPNSEICHCQYHAAARQMSPQVRSPRMIDVFSLWLQYLLYLGKIDV